VLLFHHAQGLTPGCVSFADRLRAAGHVVHTPDLYDGKTSPSSPTAFATRKRSASARSPTAGASPRSPSPPASSTRGSRSGRCRRRCWLRRGPARRARCCSTPRFQLRSSAGRGRTACRSRSTRWRDDEWGDVDVAHGLAEEIETAELFLYPGDRHLFADESLPDYDEDAAALLMERVLRFLA
jgi:dienelactone hydrolase